MGIFYILYGVSSPRWGSPSGSTPPVSSSREPPFRTVPWQAVFLLLLSLRSFPSITSFLPLSLRSLLVASAPTCFRRYSLYAMAYLYMTTYLTQGLTMSTRFNTTTKSTVAFVNVSDKDGNKVTDLELLSSVADRIEAGTLRVEAYLKDGVPVLMIRL